MNILITGGAGSLGKAFVKYLMAYNRVVIVDNNEWAIAEMNGDYPGVTKVLADFNDIDIKGFEVVIHCAAYKHVNLGEICSSSFVENNVIKTSKFFEKVAKSGAKLLFISTDKAVEPSNLYGYTKAIGEYLAYEAGGQVARLGNILNSNGSVIPLWEKQIAEGVPLTITDPEMTRYVIEADDAVKQIWSGFLAGKRLIVPDMDLPTPLLDLANQVLIKHGKGKDYPKTIIGRRLGEKMHEKLYWDNEKA